MRGIMKGLDMPNWCYTNYAVWGGLHELEKFKSKMETAQKYIRTNSDFGKHWLGNVLVSMRLLPLKDVRSGSIPQTCIAGEALKMRDLQSASFRKKGEGIAIYFSIR